MQSVLCGACNFVVGDVLGFVCFCFSTSVSAGVSPATMIHATGYLMHRLAPCLAACIDEFADHLID